MVVIGVEFRISTFLPRDKYNAIVNAGVVYNSGKRSYIIPNDLELDRVRGEVYEALGRNVIFKRCKECEGVDVTGQNMSGQIGAVKLVDVFEWDEHEWEHNSERRYFADMGDLLEALKWDDDNRDYRRRCIWCSSKMIGFMLGARNAMMKCSRVCQSSEVKLVYLGEDKVKEIETRASMEGLKRMYLRQKKKVKFGDEKSQEGKQVSAIGVVVKKIEDTN